MSDKKSLSAQELNDNDLEKVQGGAPDWEAFSVKFLEALHSDDIVITKEYKDLVEVIKTKNWIDLEIKVIPLIATDPVVKKIFLECS